MTFLNDCCLSTIFKKKKKKKKKREGTKDRGNQNRDFDHFEDFETRLFSLTGNDESSLGSRKPRLSCQSMLGAALVGLVSVLGSNIADVKLSGRQYQVFSICPIHKNCYISRPFFFLFI